MSDNMNIFFIDAYPLPCKVAFLINPILISSLQGIDRCPKCKKIRLKSTNITIDERFMGFEKNAKKASEVFTEYIKENSEKE